MCTETRGDICMGRKGGDSKMMNNRKCRKTRRRVPAIKVLESKSQLKGKQLLCSNTASCFDKLGGG